MNLQEYLARLNRGESVRGGSEMHAFMTEMSHEAMKITAELNGSYHTAEEIRQLFSELIGKPVDASFGMFPPFYTDCGKNITVGKNVFINYAKWERMLGKCSISVEKNWMAQN